MKKLRTCLNILALSCISFHLGAYDVSDFYEAIIKLNPPQSDANAGLTTFPILAFSTGTEQQAMAGAYTAVARDTGFFEANPGASSIMEKSALGVYHINVIADVNLDAITYAQRYHDLGFGALLKILHAPFTAYSIDGSQLSSSYYVESELGINLSYSFLRNYYFSGIALGANLKMAYRSIPQELYEHVLGTSVGRDQSALSLMADLGVLTRFDFLKAYVSRDRNFSLGLAIKNLGFAVLEDPLPTTASLGLAWSPLRALLLSFDLNQGINLLDLSLSESLGFGTGLAVQMTPFLSIRGGFQLKGMNPRFNLGTDLKLTGLELGLSYTLDYTSQLRLPDHFGIQIRFDLGDQGRRELRIEVDKLYIEALVALADADYLRVIELCEQCLDLDPGFTPAQETLSLARHSQELIDKIEAIRLDEAVPDKD